MVLSIRSTSIRVAPSRQGQASDDGDLLDLLPVYSMLDASQRDNRFLGDFINLVAYCCLASKGKKKQDKIDLVVDREEYCMLAQALDKCAMAAI